MLEEPTAGLNEPPDTEELLGEDFHTFPVAGGGVLLIPESQVPTPPEDVKTPDAQSSVTQPLVKQARIRYSLIAPLSIVAVNLSLLIAVFFIHIYPILTATATIFILPKSYHLSAHLTLSNVQSRIFHPVTLTQSKTVPTTGKGHQDATQATGTITLYNASILSQTIDAGTLFIGSDGVHIITYQTAVIPGATPPTEGQTTVSAHAVNPGEAGNIRAGDIQGACCRENIFADNSAFSGGQDEQNYTIVRQTDIHGVVSSLVPTLTQHIQASFQEQIRQGETLTPNLCSQNVSPDRNVGDEATNVTVTVTESCIAAAYITTDLHAKVQQALAQQARQTIGTGYLLLSYVPISPIKTSVQQGRLVIGGTFQGSMVYHFSSQDLTILRQQLAGKSSQQAGAILAHLHGVDHLTIQLEKNETFPTDPAHIHILFLQVL
jgi:hypothetical protein